MDLKLIKLKLFKDVILKTFKYLLYQIVGALWRSSIEDLIESMKAFYSI